MKTPKTGRMLSMSAILGSFILLTMCITTTPVQNAQQFPTPASVWLSRTCPSTMNNNCLLSASNDAEVNNYYNAIDPQGAKTTLSAWKSANGFGSGGDIKAYYFNNADLAIGREMHCKQTGANVACYVTNYGPPPFLNNAQNPAWPNSSQALSDAIAGHNPFATVAMEFSPPNAVTFYVFDGQGNRLDDAALDGQGPKSVPEMCMSCHGGTYSTGTHLPTGSSFLPFDLSKFLYSSQTNYTKSDQEDAFRQLNALVLATNPNPGNTDQPIATMIAGWYHNTVGTPGTTQDETFVLPGWVGQGATVGDLYTAVVKPSCLTCHIAAPQGLDWISFQDFDGDSALIQSDVCKAHDMPHAEIPYLYLQNSILALGAVENYFKSKGSSC